MGIKKGYLNRKEVAKLMGISSNQVGVLDRNGQLPCMGEVFLMDTIKRRDCAIVFYPEDIMVNWIANNNRPEVKSCKSAKGYTRHEIGLLIKRTASTVAQMCYKGKLPCKPYISLEDHCNVRRYDKIMIDQWILSLDADVYGVPVIEKVKKKLVKTNSNVTFRDIFAGKYLPHDERIENFSRLATAQASRPVTQRVSFKGIY
jgi:hypothetical protein